MAGRYFVSGAPIASEYGGSSIHHHDQRVGAVCMRAVFVFRPGGIVTTPTRYNHFHGDMALVAASASRRSGIRRART